MTHKPKIPTEQRSFGDKGGKPLDEARMERRDIADEVQTNAPGDSGVNLDQQGRYGNLKQNLTTQWKVQDR